MDRRNFLLAMSAALAASAVGIPVRAATLASKQDPKAWARAHLKGLETFVLPSFLPNLKELDEEGIRNDVRHAHRQGFISVSPVPVGVSSQERDRLLEIIADEAAGKLFTVGMLMTADWKQQEQSVRLMERVGCKHAMMLNDNSLSSQDDIYNRMRAVIERTSMGVVIYASPHPNIKKLDPTGIPLDAFDRLADLPNVVAVKLTQIIPDDAAVAVAKRLGDRLLVGPVNFGQVPMLAPIHRIQWSGQWTIDAMQSPERPYAVRFMKLLGEGKTDEALKLYSEFKSAAETFYDIQDSSLRVGGHPWMHIKYYQWLTGGNGGLLRDLGLSPEAMPPLDSAGRRRCREALEKVGIATVKLPDEAFAVGMTAYNRGTRGNVLTQTTQYLS